MVLHFLINLIALPLGYIMWFCYRLTQDYGLAIILFTLATKIILLPLSLKVQKNSIQMVKINPQINEIKMRYQGDRDRINEETLKVYEKEGYSPLFGLIPTLIQIPIILGLIDVIYKPMKHILHITPERVNLFLERACELKGVESLGSSGELQVVEMVKDPSLFPYFSSLTSQMQDDFLITQKILDFRTTFLGLNLLETPSITTVNSLLWIPVLAGVSAWLLCYFQNKENVLQAQQSSFSQHAMTIFMVCFSVYFSFIVPGGVGFYWIIGNLMAILLLYLCNAIYNPKKYIDYESLEKFKVFQMRQKEREKQLSIKKKENRQREKQAYKDFFADQHKELVFYSEKSGFYKYFKDTIEYILEHSHVRIHYVTNDPDDALFQKNHSRLIPYYIGHTRLIPLFMKMDAQIVAMTTPDLNQFQLKRSYVKEDVEYIYMPHYPLSETLGGRKGSLDYFDTIFCVSKYQMREIRELESHFGTKKKRLVETGYSFIENLKSDYDAMLSSPSNEKRTHTRKKILIAPSWQDQNILDSCLHSILKQLLKKDYDVIVRPHPEYVKRYGQRMDEIVERYKGYSGKDLSFELDFSKSDSIYNSDLLITDWSGTAYEFSFVTKKPVVFINTPPKINNPDYTILSNPPMEFVLREKLGIQIDPASLDKLYPQIEELLSSTEKYEASITQLLKEHISHFGHAGEIGGQYIIHRLRKEKTKKEND